MNIPYSQLREGDVLLVGGDGSLLCKAITRLTESDFTHAALCVKKPGHGSQISVVHENEPHAGDLVMSEKFLVQRDVRVFRRKGIEDLSGVSAVAMAAVDKQEPYAYSSLVLLALLLVYRKCTPRTLSQRVAMEILKRATAFIEQSIARIVHPGKHPMVCSEFVYQVYLDAGEEPATGRPLALRLNAGRLLVPGDNSESGLLDQVESMPFVVGASSQANITDNTLSGASENELLEQLVQRDKSAMLGASDYRGPDGLVLRSALENFGAALARAQGDDTRDGFEYMRVQQPRFVLPADLEQHCDDLQDVGRLTPT